MNPIKQFNKSIITPLRQLWEDVHALKNMRGDGFINIKRSGAGITIGLNLTEAKKRLSRKQDNSGRSRIFQVRSWASPFVFEEEFYDRTGVYNCVEMTIDDRDGFGNTYTLTESAANSGFEGRITQRDGVVNSSFLIGSTSPAKQEDFEEWSNPTAYTEGELVIVTSEYTETASSLLRKVTVIYKAILDNTGKPPASNEDTWQNITVEVYNLSEQYAFSNLPDTKLARFDIIKSFSSVDNQGTSRIVGNDCLGQTRAFHLDPAATTSVSPVVNIIYGSPTAYNPGTALFKQAQEGELGYNIALTRGALGKFDWSVFTQEATLVAFWINGFWFLHTALPNIVSNNNGLKYVGVTMEVKADEATIGFDGTGKLKQLP